MTAVADAGLLELLQVCQYMQVCTWIICRGVSIQLRLALLHVVHLFGLDLHLQTFRHQYHTLYCSGFPGP